MSEIEQLALALERVEPSLERLLVQYELEGAVRDYVANAVEINRLGPRAQLEALVEALGLRDTRSLVRQILEG